jgi:hypothetical protein
MRARTANLLRARQALSQLSYSPAVGLSGIEPLTSRLSGVRSNQLSYRPFITEVRSQKPEVRILSSVFLLFIIKTQRY